MVDRSGRSRRCAAEMSPASRAWERARIRELGLEDVIWDHAVWCPRCRAAARRASQAPTPPERMPADKTSADRPAAAPESERASAPEPPSVMPGGRSLRRGKRRRRGKP